MIDRYNARWDVSRGPTKRSADIPVREFDGLENPRSDQIAVDINWLDHFRDAIYHALSPETHNAKPETASARLRRRRLFDARHANRQRAAINAVMFILLRAA